MLCPYCSSDIPDAAAHCPYCGEAVAGKRAGPPPGAAVPPPGQPPPPAYPPPPAGYPPPPGAMPPMAAPPGPPVGPTGDVAVLVLGIVSAVLGVPGCCCYGFIGVCAIVCGIVGLVLHSGYVKKCQAANVAPSGNAKAGRILCFVGIGFAAVMIVLFYVLLIFGVAMSSMQPTRF